MIETDVVRAPLALVRALRATGVPAGTGRAIAYMEALAVLRPCSVEDLYWAGRLTLCGSLEDITKYDEVFAALDPGRPPQLLVREVPQQLTGDDNSQGDSDAEDGALQASAVEVIRHQDIADLSEDDQQQLEHLLAVLSLRAEERRTRRHDPFRGHRIDRARTVRAIMRAGGEPAQLITRRRRRRPRRVVFLVDISGSMGPYAETLLRFAHGAVMRSSGPVEVFTIGTRLTRVTEALRQRDVGSAMKSLADSVLDYRGGTRLGLILEQFLDCWGQRGMARGAVVVILSDGWERGDASLLGEQMARLGRLAHRIVWSNPRKGQPGYAPLAGGMAAALPFVDDFVEGHSLAALERLAKIVARSGHQEPHPVVPVATPGR